MARARHSLLVVDDDDDVREALVLLLEDEGYEVRGAANGREALRTLDGGYRPRAIVLDLMMPEMNGWEFRDAMRGHPSHAAVPIIVVTAVRDRSTAPQDVYAIVPKPIDVPAFLQTIEKAATTRAPAAS